jgi:hypothetical protein
MEDMQLEAGIRPLPAELGIEGTGYYLQGMNHSDDLFMFLKRRLGTDDGVVPGQEYRKSSLLSLLQMHLVVPLASRWLSRRVCVP